MTLEYAPHGLIGMLTPQANTTVEPEFSLLWPPGFAMMNARLTSDKPTIAARLVDYFANYDAALTQFANAPLRAVGAACTGASYLVGRDREQKLVAELTSRQGYPFLTAALAVIDALTQLHARRIGLVSPYPADLDAASVAYWRSYDLDVTDVVNMTTGTDTFHPIYSIAGAKAMRAVQTLKDKPLDAIVMLGTGMPTLAPIAATLGWRGPPVMSCNLCLAWDIVATIDDRQPRGATLRAWLGGDGWCDRLKLRHPELVAR
ncbi:MAG: hypothetical protein HY056_12625 [Proteobacteria bacterium]|nr:hypothetical protein [Pseudomonadota bacterium]